MPSPGLLGLSSRVGLQVLEKYHGVGHVGMQLHTFEPTTSSGTVPYRSAALEEIGASKSQV